MITADRIKYEYIRRGENDEVVAVETALDAVSFRVEKGQFIGIMGTNGSGKSTLARHLNALLIPEDGTLVVDDIDTRDEKMVFEIRQRVGMVFQNPDNQIVHDIVEDDVAFGPENLCVPLPELRDRVDDALDRVGMNGFATASPMRLSGGQKARVAIAGVLAMKPECIVFDESTAMLDPAGREDILAEAMRLCHDEGITVIWITHYPEELIEADQIFIMDHGRLELAGSPGEVFADVRRLYAMGLSVPDVTLIAYEAGLMNGGAPAVLTINDIIDRI
ncbi:MAG: energy-coupling factor transporter ATPase [Eubacterium sp.]|nr:energy-coupling factor transporter ATPase [Eubacterium sp.]